VRLRFNFSKGKTNRHRTQKEEGSGRHDYDFDQGGSNPVSPVEAATGERSVVADPAIRKRREAIGAETEAQRRVLKRTSPICSVQSLSAKNITLKAAKHQPVWYKRG